MTTLGFLTMAANMGMTGARAALRQYQRERAALREIRDTGAMCYKPTAIREIATRALKRGKKS